MILKQKDKSKEKNSKEKKSKEKIVKDELKNEDLILASDEKQKQVDEKQKKVEGKEEVELSPNKKNKNINFSDEKKHKSKRLFFGLGKEFWRITWPKKMKVANDFVTTIIVLLFFVLIFSGIGLLIGTFVK